jgi:DNA-binding transcriptional MerR regulator
MRFPYIYNIQYIQHTILLFIYMNMDNLLTTGEFAELACTTKRTIQYYDKLGILEPFKVDENGYRLYKPAQILDFQVILLLTTLRIPLKEIKGYLKNKNYKELFKSKRGEVREEINRLKSSLSNLTEYYSNLDKNSTLVKPVFKDVKAFDYYYFDRIGSYSSINKFCTELVSLFSKRPKGVATLTVFLEEGYRPKESKMRIGILKKKGLVFKKGNEHILKQARVDSFGALTYLHRGAGSTFSLMWQEVYKYMRLNGIQRDLSLPELEIYWKVVEERAYANEFELYVPIKAKGKR